MSLADAIRDALNGAGGRVLESELLYQLKKRGHDLEPLDLYEAMHDLEQAGAVESELTFRAKAEAPTPAL